MKKYVLSAVTALLCLFANAQDIPVKILKSEVFKDEYKYSTIRMVASDQKGGFVLVRSYQGGTFSSGLGYYFEHYDANLKLINDYDYPLKYSQMIKFNSILGVVMDGEQLRLIEFLYNRDERAFICSALSADIDDFRFSKQELFRMASDEIKKFAWFSAGDLDGDSGASMMVNEDGTAFAITVDIKDKDIETHRAFLFDVALNKKIDHTFRREIKDRKFVYENIEVSKDGTALYLLGKAYTDDKKKKKEGGKYQYELTRITSDSEQTQVFDTDSHYCRSLTVLLIQGRLTCLGFYSDRNDSRYKGISYFELDPVTLQIGKAKFNPFTEQFMIDKYGKNKDKELKNLDFRGLLVTEQNEIVFNAEEFYVTTTYMSNGMAGGYTSTIFHYDDIVSAKIDANGDMMWARNINKRQSTQGDESYISYSSMAKGDNTYFFINTGEKVRKLRNDRIQFGQTSQRKSNLNVIRINAQGDFDYVEILDDKDNEVPFMVAHGVHTGDSMLFLGRKGKKKQLVKVTL